MEELKGATSLLLSYYDVLITSIWVLLPIAIFLTFFAKLSSKISIFFIGFFGAYSFLIPYLLKLEQIRNLIDQYSDYKFVIYLIVSFVFGMIFYSIVKLAMSIGGLLLGGFLGYNIGTFLITKDSKWLKDIPINFEYIPWIFFAIIGIILALIISKNYEKIISGLSVIFGAFLMSFYTFYILETYAGLKIGNNDIAIGMNKLSNQEFFAMFIVFIIYMVIGFYSMRVTSKKFD